MRKWFIFTVISMLPIYLTPASISYLNQFLLALLITAYLGRRYFSQLPQQKSLQDRLLLIFFLATTLFSFLLFLDVSLLPAERLYVVYLENTVLGILLTALIQFAYYFPAPNEKQKIERWISLFLSAVYTLWEAGFAVWRFNLLQYGQVVFRPSQADILPAIGFIWVIFLFARGTIQNWNQAANRRFAWVFIIPFGLAILNLVRSYYGISTPSYHISMSVGILLAIYIFALNYLASQPEKTSFTTKFTGAMLTGMLALFGIVAWLVAPAYAEQYSANITDHRTIHFAPNGQGGYDVREITFHFDVDLGQNLLLTDDSKTHPFEEVEFDFPFFGNSYTNIFILNDSAVGIGENLNWRDFQYHLTNVPAIFPLLVDLYPEKSANGGVYLRKEPNRLVITWKDLPAFNHLDLIYTSQLILYSDGSFDITYLDLPDHLYFYTDDRPEATAWAIGVKPSIAPGQSVDFTHLPLQSGPEGLIQNEYGAFRDYLNIFLRPLALAILASSFLFLIALSALFRYGLGQPLNALLQGVQALNNGKRNVTIPVQFNDEIGFLTQSFNRMSAELDGLIVNLEDRVAKRTSELRESEERYRQLFDLESDAIFIIRNSDGQILEASNAASQLYGFSHEEILGKRNTDLSAEPEATQKTTNAPSPSDTIVKIPLRWHRKKDGTRFPVGIAARFVTWKGESVHIAAIRDITEQYQIEQELVKLAITDELTSLPNRRHFLSQAEQIFARSNHPPYGLALMMLDMDYFKNVNDQFGHAAGDKALCEVARILEENLRPTDLLARIGGEEFAILLPRTVRPEAQQIGERLCQVFASSPIRLEDREIKLTISIGVAALDESITSLDELLSRADQTLYLAKERGRNRCEIWEGN